MDFGYPKSLTVKCTVDFLEELVADGIKSKEFTNVKALIKLMLIWAVREEYLELDVMRIFWNLEISDKEFEHAYKDPSSQVFLDWELDRLIPYLKENRKMPHCMAIILMFVTGIRVGELVALQKEYLRNDNSIVIKKSETRYNLGDGTGYHYEIVSHPKTQAGYRNVYLPEEANWILKWMSSQDGEYIFMYQGHRITASAIRSKLYRICKKVGIASKGPHKLRKTYLSILLDEKCDQRLVTDQAGHASIKTSEASYHYNRKNAGKKIALLSNIDAFSRVSVD